MAAAYYATLAAGQREICAAIYLPRSGWEMDWTGETGYTTADE